MGETVENVDVFYLFWGFPLVVMLNTRVEAAREVEVGETICTVGEGVVKVEFLDG